MDTKRMLVFVCLHGSAKRLIAAEHFRRLAARRAWKEIDVTSAGIDPDLEIPGHVIKGLLEDGIDVRGRVPRKLTREDLTNAWRVVSFGCDLSGRIPPGVTVERWDDVPAVSEDFKTARNVIVTRLQSRFAEWGGSWTPSAAQLENAMQ